jgi:RNA polymerase sigma-70 factor (ECF subfamily)
METVLALPPKYRTVIHLYYYEGYATKEIAEITEQKESTVREQLTRARRKLKDFLESEGEC